MRHIGHPILGDTLYATGEVLARRPRLALHAYQLKMNHPTTMQPMCFTALCDILDEELSRRLLLTTDTKQDEPEIADGGVVVDNVVIKT